jgi:hypothetical protein
VAVTGRIRLLDRHRWNTAVPLPMGWFPFDLDQEQSLAFSQTGSMGPVSLSTCSGSRLLFAPPQNRAAKREGRRPRKGSLTMKSTPKVLAVTLLAAGSFSLGGFASAGFG